ncbi:MAG: hypothetical protein HC902_04960 [Calothrix sp. SM1_5_4]|nr:hypothetical protein [Calothrix sp. SM1_5_4]
MSEHKAVTKTVLAFALVLTFAEVNAQQKGGAKGQTVGDILKRIEANTKKVSFSKSKSALPEFKKTEEVVRQSRVNLSAVKPPSRSTLYYEEGTSEAQLERETDKGIKQLYKLSQQFKNSKRRGELWLRLAELYVEKARLIEYRIQQQYDDKIKEFQAGKTKIKPTLNLAAAQEYNKKSRAAVRMVPARLSERSQNRSGAFFPGLQLFRIESAGKG